MKRKQYLLLILTFLLAFLFLLNPRLVLAGSTFVDTTSTYGITDGTTTHYSSAWIDIDNDGDLDLYSVNGSANNKLYINNGPNQAFTDATSTYGIADGTTTHYSSAWIDIDNDGDLDLYSVNPGANSTLYLNNGPNQAFTDATSTYGIADGATWHRSSSWVDIDNDGDLDLYSTKTNSNNTLYLNNGPNQAFTDATSTYGIADGTSDHRAPVWIDIDNDGDLDLYSVKLSANNTLYINNGPNQAFTDATATYGIADGTTFHRSSSWVDIDNDGDLDLYSVNSGANNKLYINSGQGNNYLKVMVNDSNGRYQYNARVEVDRDGNNDFLSSGNLLVQYQSNSSYAGTNQYFNSQDPVGLYFGLGSDSSCKYDVRIFLPGVSPSGTPSYSFQNVCPNRTLTTGDVSVSLSTDLENTSDNTPTIKGTATSINKNLFVIEYQADSVTGFWSSCSADDGAVDSKSEAFTCNLDNAIADGSHTIYIRATDTIGTTSVVGADPGTASTDQLTIDTAGPNSSWTSNDGGGRTFSSSQTKCILHQP